jgi:hypothetical protein
VVCRNFTAGSGTEGLCVIFRSVICLNRPENSLPVLEGFRMRSRICCQLL